MKGYYIGATLLIAILLLTPGGIALAGFGISPPYVQNDSLTRGSQYVQEIFLVRGDPINDLKATINIDVPGISDWFSVDRGVEFLLPQGETKIPIRVTVRVPDDAEYRTHTGNIRIRTTPADAGRTGGGSVSIALGAQIDVDIAVVDEQIFDFRVRKISVSDLNEGIKLGWLYFPGKINFAMSIENTGNIEVSPTLVAFDIYDSFGTTLLEQTQHSNRITKVKPFETREVVAELPTKLPSGGYLVRYRIFNGEEVKQEGEINLSIVPSDTVAAAGYGFFGLSAAHKASLVIPILVVLLMVMALFTRSSLRKRGRRGR